MSVPAFKLAQPGYDVKTAGDENLVYSADWPLLKIAFQGILAMDDVTQKYTAVEHKLGYPAMFWFFANTPVGAWQNSGNIGTRRRAEFFGPVGDGSVVMDSNRLAWQPVASPGTTGKSQLYYYVFALDLTQQYNAPIIKVGAVGGGSDHAPVFKIAKPNKDLASKDLSDFIIHSRARSPLIHSVNPSPGIVKNFSVRHGLGYNPMFFAYSKNAAGQYSLLPTGQGGSSSLLSNTQDITFTDSGGKEITIVILKDPFVVDYSVRVNV